MTRRRWIAEQWTETTASLTGAQADHLARVLRAHPGVQADIVAGGRVFHAEIVTAASQQVDFKLLAEVQADPALPVTLVLSVYKFDRMEWAIEKLTELGVATIAPVIARRTEKHLAQAAPKRVERWRRIVHEAAQQSRRSDVPQILDPVSLAQYLRELCADNLRIVLSEQERATSLRALIDGALDASIADLPALALAVGPEGGWAPEEEQIFSANGWRPASLGPRILRAETAALSALSVVAAVLE